jgi:CheY-like chemotaxis protein/CheY-specific phosphatase CheX
LHRKILLVDDSSLTISLLKSVLEKNGYEICGIASDGKEAVEKYLEFLPDVVVMDYIMPVMNGIDASNEIKKRSPMAKILMFTVMNDRDIRTNAERIGIDGFLKKPFDAQKVLNLLDELFRKMENEKVNDYWITEELEKVFLEAAYGQFIESMKKIFKEMSGIDVVADSNIYEEDNEEDIESLGVSSIISYNGRLQGRFLIDMQPKLAINVTKNITNCDYESAKDDMVLATIAELNNVIAGDVITYLNDESNLELKLAPPIVFTGKRTIISIPKTRAASIKCLTKFGKLNVNIAFDQPIGR